MTFPGGQPGGYPGQGPQQPLQGPGGYGRPPGSGMKLGVPQIAHLVVAGLGVLILFLAFASVGEVPDVPGAEGSSFYEGGGGWIPALLFAGGLLSLKPFLPGEDKKVGYVAPALITAGVLTYLFSVFSTGGLGAGGIMVLIFGIAQLVASILALLMELGIMKPPAPNPYGHQQPGGMYPQSGAFPQQPPAQPQYGQQPPPPPPGQQTTFAPQQGQFGQQPQQPPGTPPGGYPQQ